MHTTITPMPPTNCPSWCTSDHAKGWASLVNAAVNDQDVLAMLREGGWLLGGPCHARSLLTLGSGHDKSAVAVDEGHGEPLRLYVDARAGLDLEQARQVLTAVSEGVDLLEEHDPHRPRLSRRQVLAEMEERANQQRPETIPPCPSWCVLEAGHRYEHYLPGEGDLIHFSRTHVSEGDLVVQDECSEAGVVSLLEAAVCVDGMDLLTAEQARILSAELLRGAAFLESWSA